MLLCAVMHPIGELPSAASYYISWNPVAHMEEKLREYALGIKPYPGISVGYPAAFALIVLFLGFASYQVNRFKVLER